MRKKKLLSNKKIKEFVENEGLGYAIQSYLDADQIADPILAVRWQIAKDTLDAIDAILGE